MEHERCYALQTKHQTNPGFNYVDAFDAIFRTNDNERSIAIHSLTREFII